MREPRWRGEWATDRCARDSAAAQEPGRDLPIGKSRGRRLAIAPSRARGGGGLTCSGDVMILCSRGGRSLPTQDPSLAARSSSSKPYLAQTPWHGRPGLRFVGDLVVNGQRATPGFRECVIRTNCVGTGKEAPSMAEGCKGQAAIARSSGLYDAVNRSSGRSIGESARLAGETACPKTVQRGQWRSGQGQSSRGTGGLGHVLRASGG